MVDPAAGALNPARGTTLAPGLNRRRLLMAGAAALATAATGSARAQVAGLTAGAVGELLNDLERRAFGYFWETAHPTTGLSPDRWPTQSFSSVASVGFALSAYTIGADRGFISRDQAKGRVLKVLRVLWNAPQGPEPSGRSGYKGFFYHFLDMATGLRYPADTELSTVDTALLIAGALHCQSYFSGSDEAEREIRALAESLYQRVDWRWAQTRLGSVWLGWRPESGFIQEHWTGYNEAMILYLLAVGSPTYALDATAWDAWISTYDTASWGTDYGQTYLRFPPMFGHQFTQCWVDLRGLQDSYMRDRGLDYFENSRRATYAQQAYAIANPEGWAGYGEDAWGVSASNGPVDTWHEFGGKVRKFITYAGRGMGGAQAHDDGTLAPYAVGSSIVFAPEIVVPTLMSLRERYGAHIYGRYGFHAFNPSFGFSDVKLRHGRLVPGFGWVDTDYLGIEQGPMLLMLANYRGQVVWNTMRRNAHLRRGLQRAGFTNGWLSA